MMITVFFLLLKLNKRARYTGAFRTKRGKETSRVYLLLVNNDRSRSGSLRRLLLLLLLLLAGNESGSGDSENGDGLHNYRISLFGVNEADVPT